MTMRVLDIVEEGKLQDNAVYEVLARMFFPDDEISAAQFVSVVAWESQRKLENPKTQQGPIMASVEKELAKTETLGRMAGDVALKMLNEHGRGGNDSLEYAATFISDFYASSETKGERYPTDTKRLQESFRRLKNSIHYWAAWQCCQDIDGFDFIRNAGNLWQMLLQAGLIQDTLKMVPYFQNWQPWLVPAEIAEAIQKRNLGLGVLEETDFERAFGNKYFNKMGRN